jgi:hypothetical protein
MRPADVARWLLLAYLVYAVQHQLRTPDEMASGLFGAIIFGSHELGHLVFAPFGEPLGVAGGSLMQLLVPVGAAWYFAHRGDRYAAAVCGCWLALSLGNLAVYIGDARAESLDLVSFSPDGGIHDWNYLLERFGVLRDDRRVAAFARMLGWLTLAAGTGVAAFAIRGSRGRAAPDAPGDRTRAT